MITRINQFEAKENLQEELFGFLQSVISVVEECHGCISFRLLRSTENPAHFAIIEEWESVEDHRSAASAIPPEQMARAMVLFAQPPTGTYYEG